MFDLTHEFQSLSSQGNKIHSVETPHCRAQSVAYRGGGFKHPPPEIPKALQNRAKLNQIVKTIKNCWI